MKLRIKNRNDLFQSCLFAVMILLTAVLVPGCVHHLTGYSKAQEYFNTAARMDMERTFFPDPDMSGENILVSSNQINSNYALAHALISELIEKNKKELKEDGLLGNAMTIRAMSEWKLGKYIDARKTAAQALKESRDRLFPRDLALMTAMPGLIKADQAYFHIMNPLPQECPELLKKTPAGNNGAPADSGKATRKEECSKAVKKMVDGGEGEMESAGKLLDMGGVKFVMELVTGNNGAIGDFEEALKKVDNNHPVRIYLMMSELAALRTLQKAIGIAIKKSAGNEELNDRLNDEEESLSKEYIKPKLEEFEKKLVKMNLMEQWGRVLSYWKVLLGFS